MPASSASVSANPWRFVRLSRMTLPGLARYSASAGGTSANAPNSSSGGVVAVRPGGPLAREQPRQELGAVGRQLEQRLVQRCTCRLPRRMSRMNAIRGLERSRCR